MTASTAINGKDGNKRSLGVTAELAYAARGERKNMVDAKSISEWSTDMKLSYARTIANKPPPTPPKSPVTADEGNASLDFEDNSLRQNSLLAINHTDYHLLAYTRAEAGFNRPLDLRQYNMAAAGLGLISDQGGARVRVGLGYRNEDYITPGKRSLANVSLDFGLRFALEIGSGKLDNDFTTVLSASNNVRSKDTLSMKFGKEGSVFTFGPKIVWEYESRPEPSNKRLNTTYLTEAKVKF